MRQIVLSLGLFLAITGFTSAGAWACSCGVDGSRGILEYGDLVAAGTVISIKKTSDTGAEALPNDDMEAVVRLSDVWKGEGNDTVTLTYFQGDGGNCGTILNEGDQFSFTAYRDKTGQLTITSCDMGRADRDPDPDLEAYRQEARSIAADIKAQPNSIAAQLRLGRHYESGHELERASVVYRHVLEQDPQSGGGYAGLARVQLLRGKSAEAIAMAMKGLTQLPEDTELTLLKHQLQVLRGEKVDPGTLSFRSFDASDFTLSGVDLRRVDFSGARLSRGDFSVSQLDGVIFTNATLRAVTFAYASMIGVDFSNAEIFPAGLPLTFYGATLRNANLSWTKSVQPRQMNPEDFLESDLTGARFSGNYLLLDPGSLDPDQAATFAKADLTNATLECSPLSYAFGPIVVNVKDPEKNWKNALKQLSIIRNIQKAQPGAIWGKSCVAETEYYLSLPSDCRPWAPQPGQTGCAFLPE